MSIYLVEGKGWRYDFTLKGTRHTETWFMIKRAAKQAEAKRREEVKNPKPVQTPTDMVFLELINKRLDHVQAYNSKTHYGSYTYLAKRWVKNWGVLMCSEITREMIRSHILERRKVSGYTANQDLRYLRAAFNFGIKNELISNNPTEGIEFFPVEKRVKYIPSSEDIDKVIEVADPDTQDYLWSLRETMARVSEINRLTWDDVSLDERYVILYTRKMKGGNFTPRKVPMTQRLFDVHPERYQKRGKGMPWVFWHTYWSSKSGEKKQGPYVERKRIMKTLCKKAGVKYFRFHPIRHSGASIMDSQNSPIGSIQRILGHENRRTTEVYLHSIGEMEHEAIARFEQAREKSHTVSHTENLTQKKRIRRGHLTLIKY